MKDEVREKYIEQLAKDLEHPRAIRLIAEWLAIDHDETRYQSEIYLKDAEEFEEFLRCTVGYHLVSPERLTVLADEEINTICNSRYGTDCTNVDCNKCQREMQLAHTLEELLKG